MFDLFSGTEVVENIIDKFQQLADEVFNRHLLLLTKIQELAVESISNGPPFVLLDETAVVKTETEVSD